MWSLQLEQHHLFEMLLEDLDLADADVSRSDIFGVASGATILSIIHWL
jgi:hypothetical protein